MNKYKILSSILILILFSIIKFFETYLKWPDFIVDFGRELYVPWQLAEGKALFKDIQYFQGPFSPLFNSLIFKFFGTKIIHLAVANLFIFLCILISFFSILYKMSNLLTANMCCVVIIFVFGFNQYLNTSNYNYITPYAHEITHGMLLSLISLFLANKVISRSSYLYPCLLGICLGTLFLTKPEMSIAGTSGAFVTIIFGFLGKSSQNLIHKSKIFMNLIFSFFLPIFLIFFFLITDNAFHDSLVGLFGGFSQLFKHNVTANVFQQAVLGFDHIPIQLTNVASGAFMLIGSICIIVTLSMLSSILIKSDIIAITTGCGLIILIGSFLLPWIPIPLLVQGMPALLMFILFLIFLFNKLPQSPIQKNILPLVMGYIIFSILLFLRMLLHLKIEHYGFAFALPTTLLILLTLLYWLPETLKNISIFNCKRYVYSICTIIIIITFRFHLVNSFYSSQKQHLITNEFGDHMYVDKITFDRFKITKMILNKYLKLTDTLVVLPEGIMFNYFNRLQNPTGYDSLNPISFDIYGETSILDRFKSHSPDYILYYTRSGAEWGKPNFGRDFGVSLYQWIENNYTDVWSTDPKPFKKDELFGIQLKKRTGI